MLALTYLHPEASYTFADIAQCLGVSTKSVHVEALRLVRAGFLVDTRVGSVHTVCAPAVSPLTLALTNLLVVTYGPLPVLRDLLSGVAGIERAFIFGSWAARYTGEQGGVPHDVDVLIVGTIDRDDLYRLMCTAEETLRREVNPIRVDAGAWDDPTDPFLITLYERPLVELVLT
jgi:hypothetical protein